MTKGLFIALEGIDGSGKSTQARLLAAHLQGLGSDVYATFEPTKNFIGALIRDILTGKRKADEATIAGLFLADRLDHLNNTDYGLVNKVAAGSIVVCDRYYFSSYAYHGVHVDMDWVIRANQLCANILKPDINIFIDVPPEVCMTRIVAGRQATELYETTDNLVKVRNKYLEAFAQLAATETVLIIDGHRPPDVVATEIMTKVSALY